MNSKLALEFYQLLKGDTITHGKWIHAARAWQQACKSYKSLPRKVRVNIYRGVADEKKIIYACSLLPPNLVTFRAQFISWERRPRPAKKSITNFCMTCKSNV